MKKSLIAVAILLSFCVAAIAQNPLEEIEKIKQIQALTRDASWTPAITSVSYLTHEERVALCGLYPVLGYKAENPLSESRDLRGSVDLRDLGLVTAIKNQASCGSCWAFAMTACVETANGGGSLNLSEQQLVSCCKDGCDGCNGGSISSVAAWVKNYGGLYTESVYPYTSGGGVTGTCKTVSGTKYNIAGYGSCGSDSSIKTALNNNWAVDTGMYVYSDFMYYSGGVYRHTSGGYEGGHAVCIVGYDDANGCWIIKNSWGTGWGESGYFRMAYGECNVPWMAVYVK